MFFVAKRHKYGLSKKQRSFILQLFEIVGESFTYRQRVFVFVGSTLNWKRNRYLHNIPVLKNTIYQYYETCVAFNLDYIDVIID